MKYLNNLKISVKLPAFIVSFLMIACCAVGVSAYLDAKDAVFTEVESKLTAILAARKSELGGYMASIEEDLLITADSPATLAALNAFESGWNTVGDNPTGILQRLYIFDNPQALRQKDKYYDARDGSSYSKAHVKFHPWFHQLQQKRGYYDVFLFDSDGNLVYSVFKENDYATNMNMGEWRDTDLARVFKDAVNATGKGSVSFYDFRPYAPSADAPASFMATPIMGENGSVAGVLAFQMPIGKINAIMQKNDGMGESGESYLVGEDHLMRSDSRFSKEPTILKTKIIGETTTAALKGNSGIATIQDYRDISVVSAYTDFNIHGSNWAIIAEIDTDEVNQPIDSMRNGMIMVGLVIMAVLSAIALVFTKTLVQPISDMVKCMGELAQGGTSVDVPGLDRQDEIGAMATSVNVFKVNAIERVRLEKEAEETRIAQEEAEKRRQSEARAAEEKKLAEEKRLEKEAQEKRLADRLEMAQRFEDRVGGVLQTVSSAATELNATSESMNGSANKMKEESVSAAAATTQAGQNVQLVASAAEEMTVSVKEISSQINNASAASKNALNSVNDASAKVTQMADSSDKISEVILLINDIAEQTNLLALNATIEAARAGDAGKGFAVVASEVKNLAGQTASATDEIRAQINEMQETTSDTVSAVQEISVTIGELDKISSSIAAAVEQQACAMQEISRNSLEAATGTETAGENVKTVSQLAEETGNAASDVLSASNELSGQATTLQGAVDEFLTEIRTG